MQLSEWMAFDILEPFGYKASLHPAGIVSSVVANVNRKKGSKPFKPSDFLPDEKVKEETSFFDNLKRFFKSKRK